MKIDILIDKLTKLKKICPNATIYFTDETCTGTFETYFEDFYVDLETGEIEMKFDINMCE